MAIVYGNPFKIDWCNLQAVIEYAYKLGVGNVVIKHCDRPNYNIHHANRMADLPDAEKYTIVHTVLKQGRER